jgi:hypothetical protein
MVFAVWNVGNASKLIQGQVECVLTLSAQIVVVAEAIVDVGDTTGFIIGQVEARIAFNAEVLRGEFTVRISTASGPYIEKDIAIATNGAF